MRIVPGTAGPEVPAASAVSEAGRIEAAAPSPAPAGTSSGSEALQSVVLQPALAALREMPDIDQAKVAQLRDALAKGELPFNAGKLAALIESYHRDVK
jgi:negative regulator of flagellin synthesis FlgM